LEFVPLTSKYSSENVILTCCKDATIHLLDIAKELIICQFIYFATPPPETCHLAWRNDGLIFGIASLDGTITFWEIDKEI
jgi:WD40 repeat protein